MTDKCGEGWSVATLDKCRKFYRVFSRGGISSTIQTKLTRRVIISQKDNFIRITLPISAHDHASVQVEKLVSVLTGEMGRSELQGLLSIKNRDYFRTDYLNPAINTGYIELTIPDKPNSQNQKYRLTAKGIALKEHLKDNK